MITTTKKYIKNNSSKQIKDKMDEIRSRNAILPSLSFRKIITPTAIPNIQWIIVTKIKTAGFTWTVAEVFPPTVAIYFNKYSLFFQISRKK
jgi:hypothetical protein